VAVTFHARVLGCPRGHGRAGQEGSHTSLVWCGTVMTPVRIFYMLQRAGEDYVVQIRPSGLCPARHLSVTRNHAMSSLVLFGSALWAVNVARMHSGSCGVVERVHGWVKWWAEWWAVGEKPGCGERVGQVVGDTVGNGVARCEPSTPLGRSSPLAPPLSIGTLCTDACMLACVYGLCGLLSPQSWTILTGSGTPSSTQHPPATSEPPSNAWQTHS
jgi:hypothetical protein